MKYILLVLCIAFCSCSEEHKYPRIRIESGLGDIEIELYPDKAPKTVAAFLSFIDSGFYKDVNFYRVLKTDESSSGFNPGLIQGGTYRSGKLLKVNGIPHESTITSGLSHTNGTISLARTDPGTATTEFFICIGDKIELDAGMGGGTDSLGMAAFGKVLKGMDIVRKIQDQKSNGDLFIKPIEIKRIKRL